MTKAKHGRQTCVSSPSLTLWKTSGRKFIVLFIIRWKQSEKNPNLVNSYFLFRLYNHIQLSSNLMSGCDYSLFKVECFYFVFLKNGTYNLFHCWMWCYLPSQVRSNNWHSVCCVQLICTSEPNNQVQCSVISTRALARKTPKVFNRKSWLML